MPVKGDIIPLEKRFWSKVKKTNTCWIWKACRNKKGYGEIWNTKGSKLAHIVAFELLNGKVPKYFVLDHLCENTSCVNPAHLNPTSSIKNIKRSSRWCGNRTHCPQGHEYNRENTRITFSKRGYKVRHCIPCNQDAVRRYQKRKKDYESLRRNAWL